MLVVTGTQRSGTRYLATVLYRAGVDATHEGNVPGTAWRDHQPWDGPRRDVAVDVNWYNAWWLDSPQLADATVVHLVRWPLHSIASSVVRRTFAPRTRPSGRWACDRIPSIAVGDNVERATRYWLAWNELVEPHAHRLLRIEEATADAIGGALDLAGVSYDPGALNAALVSTRRDVNTNAKGRQPLDWSDLPDELRDAVAAKARQYGYRTEG